KADAAVTATSAAGKPEEVGTETAHATALVLVVDDDPDVRGFMASTLEDQGYRVRQACDGREGLAQLEHEKPDLVIVDFIMPGMSGADVAKQIRVRHPDQPILFVSGYSETDAVKSTTPDALLLTKPFRADALHKAVRGAITPRS